MSTGELKRTHVLLTPDLVAWLDQKASDTSTTRSTALRQLLRPIQREEAQRVDGKRKAS